MERKINKATFPLRHSMKSLDKYPKEKGITLYQLQILNNKLENEHIQKKKFLQKMKQQRIISQKIGQFVNEQIGKVQNNGTYFASRLQQEKRKYNILKTLVTHYQLQIYNEKKQKHNQQTKIKKINKSTITNSTFYHQNNNQNNQNKQQEITKNQQLQQSLSQLDQLQKNYEQFIVKNNNSQYQLSNKLDQVRTLRSERTIFNKIFDQFQKQLFNHQFTYKQLVIQRSVLESSFQQKIKEYEILNLRAQKQCQKQISNHKKKLQTERKQFMQELSTRRQETNLYNDAKKFSEQSQRYKLQQKTNQNKYYQQIPSNRFTVAQEMQIKEPRFQQINQKSFLQKKVQFKLVKTSGGYTNRSKLSHSRGISNNLNSIRSNEKKSIRQKPINESKNLEYEQKVKDIYNDLKISYSSQIPQLVFNLQEKVDLLYKQAENLYEKIYEKQKFLQNTYKKIKQTYQIGKIVFENPKICEISDQNRKMQEYITQRQQLYDKINISQDQNQKVINQIKDFIDKQILKLQDLFQAQNITIRDILDPQLKEKDLKQQEEYFQIRKEKLEKLIQILQRLLKNIVPVQNQASRILYLPKKQNKVIGNKQRLDQSSNYRQTESKRDTHKSAQSDNILANLSNNSYFFKFREDRDKQNQHNYRQKFHQDIIQDEFDENCLQQILKANRTTHNNMSIYSQQQLIQISKMNLSMAKSKNRKKHQYTPIQKQFKSQTDRNQEDNLQIRKNTKLKESKIYCQSQQPSIIAQTEAKSIY